MTSRNVRDLLIEAWEGALLEEGCAPSRVHALALKLAVLAEAHGVRLARPAHLHDPVADDWHGPRRPRPGDAAAGAAAVRSQIARPAPAPTGEATRP